VPQHIEELYWSLFGAPAYATTTQFWLAVYIVALQRQTTSPLAIHVRRLNALVRVAQRKPARITYRAMRPTGTLECHADSGFTREQEKEYGGMESVAPTFCAPVWNLPQARKFGNC